MYPVLGCPLSHIFEVDKEVYSVSSPQFSSLTHVVEVDKEVYSVFSPQLSSLTLLRLI